MFSQQYFQTDPCQRREAALQLLQDRVITPLPGFDPGVRVSMLVCLMCWYPLEHRSPRRYITSLHHKNVNTGNKDADVQDSSSATYIWHGSRNDPYGVCMTLIWLTGVRETLASAA